MFTCINFSYATVRHDSHQGYAHAQRKFKVRARSVQGTVRSKQVTLSSRYGQFKVRALLAQGTVRSNYGHTHFKIRSDQSMGTLSSRFGQVKVGHTQLKVRSVQSTGTLSSRYGQVKVRARSAQGTVRSKYGHAQLKARSGQSTGRLSSRYGQVNVRSRSAQDTVKSTYRHTQLKVGHVKVRARLSQGTVRSKYGHAQLKVSWRPGLCLALTNHGSAENRWEYCEIQRKCLSGNWQHWTTLRSLTAARSFRLVQFVFMPMFSRTASVFISYFYRTSPQAEKKCSPPSKISVP